MRTDGRRPLLRPCQVSTRILNEGGEGRNWGGDRYRCCPAQPTWQFQKKTPAAREDVGPLDDATCLPLFHLTTELTGHDWRRCVSETSPQPREPRIQLWWVKLAEVPRQFTSPALNAANDKATDISQGSLKWLHRQFPLLFFFNMTK